MEQVRQFIRDNDFEGFEKALKGEPELAAKPDEAGWTPLHVSASLGRLAFVRALLDTFAVNPNQQTNGGQTALHYAASKGHLEICQFLLSNSDTMLLKDKQGWTPAYRAVTAGRPDILSCLLSASNNIKHIDDRDAEGNTLLHVAVQEGSGSCVKLLRELGASVDTRNQKGKLPIDYATSSDMRDLLR